MNRKHHLNVSLLLVSLTLVNSALASSAARAFEEKDTALSIRSNSRQQPNVIRNNRVNQTGANTDLPLTKAQKSLMEGSKRAIIKTGMSETYFNKHFHIVQVVDNPADRRVVWRFALNEYEAIVNDSIGYHTEGGIRKDIHGVASLFSSTSDIERTITRQKADRIMRACLGEFGSTAIEYRADDSGKAGLFLTAASIPKPKRLSRKETADRKRKLEEAESREKAAKEKRGNETDVVDEEEGEDRPPIFLGSVNLETGKCRKGIAQAGPPKPQ